MEKLFDKTKREFFEEIKAVLTDPEQIKFIDHEIELLTKRNANKSEKSNTEIIRLKNIVLETLGSGGMTCTEIYNATATEWKSVQQANSILTKLKDDGSIIRKQDGKKVTFILA